METVYPVGIDFGTANCRVGFWQDTHGVAIPDEGGLVSIPSCVAFTDEGWCVGYDAWVGAPTNPKNTVFGLKRLIGRRYSDPSIQKLIPTLPYAVVAGPSDALLVEVKMRGEVRRFTPVELTAMLFRYLKSLCERFIGAPVAHVIFTTPANWSMVQRLAVVDASTLAGLRTCRFISQNGGTALNYNLGRWAGDDEVRVVVVDIGAGVTECSVVATDEGIDEILAVRASDFISGKSCDQLLAKHCANEILTAHGVDCTQDALLYRRLQRACERAKCWLSTSEVASVELQGVAGGSDVTVVVTRAQFEAMVAPMYIQLAALVRDTLRTVHGAVNLVLFVGGCSRIPVFQSCLQRHFGSTPVRIGDSGVTASAFGAAAQQRFRTVDTSLLPPVLARALLIEMYPFTVGVACTPPDAGAAGDPPPARLGASGAPAGGILEAIIPPRESFPITRSVQFTTDIDGQRSVSIHLVEYDPLKAGEGVTLCVLDVDGLPPAPQGAPVVHVRVHVSALHEITVEVTSPACGLRREFDVGPLVPGRLVADDVTRWAAVRGEMGPPIAAPEIPEYRLVVQP